MKKFILFCFIYPFVFSGLNIQGWVSLYISSGFGQAMSYLNLVFIFVGMLLLIKDATSYSSTARLWIFFYLMYYSFAVIGSIIYENPFSLLRTLVSVIYAIGFISFLRFEENRDFFKKSIIIVFTVANILLIIFMRLNFDFDYYDTDLEYSLDRAQGVYGDANNAAIVCNLGYLFLAKFYQPEQRLFKFIKVLLILLTVYSLFLTFSTTGFGVLIIIVSLMNYKLVTKKTILLSIIVIPILYGLLINLDKLTSNLDLNIRQQDKINNIVNILSFKFDEVDSSGRSDLVTTTLNYIYENPFLGRGLEFGIRARAHNTFLYIWADAGVFTLLLFLFILFTYARKSLLTAPETRYFALSILIVFMVFMLSLQSVINQPYLMPILIYLAYLIDVKKT